MNIYRYIYSYIELYIDRYLEVNGPLLAFGYARYKDPEEEDLVEHRELRDEELEGDLDQERLR